MKTICKWSLAAVLICISSVGFAKPPANTLIVAHNIDDVITLDPAETFEFTGGEIIANVYDRVMMYEPEDLSKLTGGVAESWTVSGDGKTIRFQIRSGLKFHSGNPVTAADAVFSLRRVIKLNKTPSFILKQFGWTAENVDQLVRLEDDRHFSITIQKEYAPTMVLNCLAAGVGSVVDKQLVLSHQKNGDSGHAWLKRNSAGSGAFKLKTWRPNNSVVLEANTGYRHGAPEMKRVVMRHINEANSQRLLLEKGDIDIARGLNTAQLDKLQNSNSIVIKSFPQAAVHFFGLNQKISRLQNPKVWEAMKWAVDYKGMTGSFLNGQYKIHQAFWPSGFPGALTETPYHLDIPRAKKLLAEAGYPDGFTMDMDVINAPVFMDMAQSLQQTLAQAGIRVNIVPGTGAQVITKYRARTHEALLIYWGPDFMDPHSNAGSFAYNADNSDSAKISSSAWRNAWDMPELSQLTTRASTERDPVKRLNRYLEIQRLVQQESPYVIMFQNTMQVALGKNVTGFISGPTSDTIYYRMVRK